MRYPTHHRTTHSTGSRSSTEKPGRKTRRPLLLLHGLPSSSRMFEPLLHTAGRAAIIWSLPTILASDTATGPTQSSSHTPSTTSPK